MSLLSTSLHLNGISIMTYPTKDDGTMIMMTGIIPIINHCHFLFLSLFLLFLQEEENDEESIFHWLDYRLHQSIIIITPNSIDIYSVSVYNRFSVKCWWLLFLAHPHHYKAILLSISKHSNEWINKFKIHSSQSLLTQPNIYSQSTQPAQQQRKLSIHLKNSWRMKNVFVLVGLEQAFCSNYHQAAGKEKNIYKKRNKNTKEKGNLNSYSFIVISIMYFFT